MTKLYFVLASCLRSHGEWILRCWKLPKWAKLTPTVRRKCRCPGTWLASASVDSRNWQQVAADYLHKWDKLHHPLLCHFALVLVWMWIIEIMVGDNSLLQIICTGLKVNSNHPLKWIWIIEIMVGDGVLRREILAKVVLFGELWTWQASSSVRYREETGFQSLMAPLI